MNIGLVDVDSHRFPNLALMKISAYHKSQGDEVTWADKFTHYDKVYISKIFGNEYSQDDIYPYNADEIVYGGTGYAISVENGIEVYHAEKDKPLNSNIEHMYPNYELYPHYNDMAVGFLTRGCPNQCSFCIVSKKDGCISKQVADLKEFYNGQKKIAIMDANILACRDREKLLNDIIKTKAMVSFKQGLDARFMTKDLAKLIIKIRMKSVSFAFDFMKNEKQIIEGLKNFREVSRKDPNDTAVFILTNYDTTLEEDIYRIRKVQECGFKPDIRIYRKQTAPRLLRDLQRWANNRIFYNSCDFMDFVPRVDGKTLRQIYF